MRSTARWSQRRDARLAGALAALAASLGLIGIGWGLPSRQRTERVLPTGWRTASSYRELTAAHVRIWGDMGQRIVPPPAPEDIIIEPDSSRPAELLQVALDRYLLFSRHPDETITLLASGYLFPEASPVRPRWRLYGEAYLSPLGALLKAVGGRPGLEDAFRDPDGLRKLYVAGRLLSVFGLALCALFAYLLARLFLPPAWAAFGVLLFVLSPASVVFAHQLKPHVWTAWLCLASCFFAARWSLEGSLADGWLAFAALAFGAASGLHALAFAPLVAALLASRGRSTLTRLATRTALFTAAAGLAAWAFASASSGILWTRGPIFFHELNGYLEVYPWSWAPRRFADFAWNSLGLGLGRAFSLAGLSAAAYAAWRGERLERALGLGALGLFLVSAVFFEGPAASRFFLAPAGLFALLAAWLLRRLSSRRKELALAAAAALLGLGAAGVWRAEREFLLDESSRANEAAAARWIEMHVAPGASIGMTVEIPTLDDFPAIRFERYRLVYLAPGRRPPPASGWPAFYVVDPLVPAPLPPWLDSEYGPPLRFDGPLDYSEGKLDVRMMSFANPPIWIYSRKGA